MSAATSQPASLDAEYVGEMYLVKGWGETALPEVALVPTLGAAKSMLLQFVFGEQISEGHSNADEARGYMDDLDECTEWPLTIRFEIGGIDVDKVFVHGAQKDKRLDAEYGELWAFIENARKERLKVLMSAEQVDSILDSRAQLVERVAVLEAAKPAVADKQFMRNLQDLLEDDSCPAIERVKIASLAIDGAILAATPHPHADEAAKVGWMPIETAPMDGYMLVHEDDAIRAMMRVKGVWRKTAYPAIIAHPFGETIVGDDALRFLPAGYRLEALDGCCENPTHWMPLPAAPSSPAEGAV